MGAAYEFFCILGVKFPSLGTQKQFTFDQISLSEVDKTAVWGKICGRNPQRGDRGSVQVRHLMLGHEKLCAGNQQETRAEDDGKTAERKRRGVSFAPALLSY